MPKKRVADIARERGLEPAEVARRLAAAGVRLAGDTVDEAAAARALGGSRPVRAEKRPVVAPALAAVPASRAPARSGGAPTRPGITAPPARATAPGAAP